MAQPSEGVHQQSLLGSDAFVVATKATVGGGTAIFLAEACPLVCAAVYLTTWREYANQRMDQEMYPCYRNSRTEDVDLSLPTYELTGQLGPSAFRDKIRVLNITDVPLSVLVLPLSYGDETLGGISARLATPEPEQIRWAMQEATRRTSAAVYSLNVRNDLVLYDGLNVTVSDVLLVIANVQEETVSVLDARRVSATENFVLAVLPGLLLEGSGPVPLQPGGLAKTVVEEILDRMEISRELECDEAVQPPITVRLTFAAENSKPGCVRLAAGLGDTMGSIRDRLGVNGVENGQDMYICHNGKLLRDDCVLSDLEFWEYRGRSPKQDDLVLRMYLLPGRAQGRLSHIPESGVAFDGTPALLETEVRFTRNQTMLSVKTHPLSSVRHIKILAIRENIARAGSCGGLGREHSKLDFPSRHDDSSCPLQFALIRPRVAESGRCAKRTRVAESGRCAKRPRVEPGRCTKQTQSLKSSWRGDVESSSSSGRCDLSPLRIRWPSVRLFEEHPLRPRWPWESLRLPLEEREFDEKELNPFDVRTFKKYFSNKVAFVNRTSRPVHISCFPTWSKDRRVSAAGVNIGIGGVEVGPTVEIGTTLRYLQGYGAVDNPCLAARGAYEIVNIANGMVREMSVVFGVESEDGGSIEYKRQMNVKGGQQVDVLETFVRLPPTYVHPVGQPSNNALVKHFLCRLSVNMPTRG